MHAGPMIYNPDNHARKPAKGRKGATEKVAKKKRSPRTHEAKGRSAPKGRGFGKIKTTGKPRFTRFSKF